jgi:hypothetical protein
VPGACKIVQYALLVGGGQQTSSDALQIPTWLLILTMMAQALCRMPYRTYTTCSLALTSAIAVRTGKLGGNVSDRSRSHVAL